MTLRSQRAVYLLSFQVPRCPEASNPPWVQIELLFTSPISLDSKYMRISFVDHYSCLSKNDGTLGECKNGFGGSAIFIAGWFLLHVLVLAKEGSIREDWERFFDGEAMSQMKDGISLLMRRFKACSLKANENAFIWTLLISLGFRPLRLLELSASELGRAIYEMCAELAPQVYELC